MTLRALGYDARVETGCDRPKKKQPFRKKDGCKYMKLS
jgi:hypothetical protein